MSINLKILPQSIFIFLFWILFVFLISVNKAYTQEQSLADQLRALAERVEALESAQGQANASPPRGAPPGVLAGEPSVNSSEGCPGMSCLVGSGAYLHNFLTMRNQDRHTSFVANAVTACGGTFNGSEIRIGGHRIDIHRGQQGETAVKFEFIKCLCNSPTIDNRIKQSRLNCAAYN